jgi:CheY-like chemotaxis protein
MEKSNCLLIDDDLEEIEIFRIALGSFPHMRLTHFLQSSAALEYLSNTLSPPQYIFVDLNMPVIRGKELISKIRKLPHLLPTPVYTYTTSSLQKDKNEALAAGANGFVTKPPNLVSLIKILQDIFKKNA